MKKNKPQLLIQNNLNPAQAKILNALNKNNTLNYSKLIDKIFKTTNLKKKWIITPILSRDFAQSEVKRRMLLNNKSKMPIQNWFLLKMN